MRGRAATMVLGVAALASCGGPTKKQRAEYVENGKHYTPPDSLSRAEYGGIVERRFRALDRNDDLYLSTDELPAVGGELIAMLDKDHDGRVSAQEFSDGMLARFDRIDLNHDGVMTWDEFQAVRHPGARGRHHPRHPPR